MDKDLIKKWTDAGQGHVFKWVDSLSTDELKSFQEQLKKFDIESANRIFTQSMQSAAANAGSEGSAAANISPFTDTTVLGDATAEDRDAWRARGLQAIAEGQVATLLLAGGQGTRLGYNHPKGMYNLGLPSKKTLFQLHAERILKAQKLAADWADQNPLSSAKKPCPPLPWYIMTSGPTHDETVAFFKDKAYFGLQPDQVFFFQQGTLPCFTFDGKVIMSSAGKIAEAPDGNGGVYLSALRSGALDDMERRGVVVVCQFGVDNCLAVPAHPEMIGFQLAQSADCCPKVVAKRSPSERVGTMALVDGKPAVVEYSEISEAMANERDSEDRLKYRSCHICVNNYTVPFLRRIVADDGILAQLPYHVAKKAIPAADWEQSGAPATAAPPQPNGVKLEAFIFDVFPHANRLVALEVERDDHFAPLKNASGSAAGSNPETCRQLVSSLAQRRIVAAGGKIDGSPDTCEISPLVSLTGEGLESICKGKTFSGPNILLD